MIKILHAADFHLDSAFSALGPEQAAQRRREQRLALEQLAKAAAGCDLILLPGDLFDSARIYRDSIEALKGFFSSVSARIFIAPGNHDCLLSGSPYLTEDWGENVHIFTAPNIKRVRLDDLGCDVYGAAYVSPEQGPLLRDFHVADEAVVNLMVLHGDTQPGSIYAPVLLEEIAASGLDYLALGHVHSTQVFTAGKTTCAYPGCLMGRGFDECGPKGVLRVTLEANACKTEFIPISARKYEILTVEAGADPLAAIRAALPADTGADCYRILLTGECAAVDVDALEQALQEDFFSLSVRDHTLPPRQLWEACGEDSLRGHFLAELKAKYDSADEAGRRTLALAARYMLALMDGREVSL